MRSAIKTLIGAAGLAAVTWSGIRVKPRRTQPPRWRSVDLGTVSVPAGLPAPVARYANTVFGDSIPVIESALIIGRADLTIGGVKFNAGFRFYHQAGLAYYHEIHLTWFGLPAIKVDEGYKDREAVMKLPGTRVEHDRKTNAAANQGLWAESIWLPSIWFTDQRVQWTAIDEASAKLSVPDAAPDEHLTVAFDPDTGLIQDLTTMRYEQAHDPRRHRWTNTPTRWKQLNGVRIPSTISTRYDNDRPWAVWSVDDALYNIDVSERFANFGGRHRGEHSG
jgi:hypothetical protein